MSSTFGQLRQDYRVLWPTNRGSVAYGVAIDEIAPEQIGAFAVDKYNHDEKPVSLKRSEINFNKHSRIALVMGLHQTTGSKNTYWSRTNGHPRKTTELTKGQIVDFWVERASRGAQPDIVALGYDGIDVTKDLGKAVRLDSKPLRVNFRFSGGPIQMFLKRNFFDYSMDLDKGLCVGDCDCYDPCGKVNSEYIVDEIIRRWETEFVYAKGHGQALHKVPLSYLAKARKIVKYANGYTAPAVATKKYLKYTISIPAAINGVEAKVAEAIQQGTGYTLASSVTFEGKDGDLNNLYSVWVAAPTGGGANPTLPTVTFEDYLLPVCDTCPTCPVESTVIEGYKTVQVRVAHGAEVPTIEVGAGEDPLEIGEPLLLTSDFDAGDVYLITYPATVTDEDITETFGEAGVVNIVGVDGKYCLAGETEFEWTTCEEAFTTTKKFQIILPGKDCDTSNVSNRLAELQAAYPDLVISTKKVGTCITAYETTIESDRLPAEKCDRLMGQFTFKSPGSYDGFLWTESYDLPDEPVCVPAPAEEKPCAVAGVIFETARWNDSYTECGWGYSSYDISYTRPVKLQVNIHDLDITEPSCGLNVSHYSTVLQVGTYEKGPDGGLLLEEEKQQLGYENPLSFSLVPMHNDFGNFRPVIDPTKLYDVYTIKFYRREDRGTWGTPNQEFNLLRIPVLAGQGKNGLEDFLNTLVLSNNPHLKAVKA